MKKPSSAASVVVAALAVLSACTSPPKREVLPVENVTFRLGAKPNGVEIRLESGYFPASGYELQASVTDPPARPEEGATILLTGVLVPLESKGARAPAAALVFLPLERFEGVPFPLLLKLQSGPGAARLDPYTLEHSPAGWRLSREQGGFSRFERQGSF